MEAPRRVLFFGPNRASLAIEPAARLETIPAFPRAFQRASALFERRLGWSAWSSRRQTLPLDGISKYETCFVRECVLQLSVLAALRDEDVPYDAVGAASLGEFSAAHAAGVLSFEEAIEVSCEVLKASSAARGGDLVAVRAAPRVARELLDGLALETAIDAQEVSVWAVPDEHDSAFQGRLVAAGVESVRMHYDCMPHTTRVAGELVVQALSRLTARAPTMPYFSTVTGARVQGPIGGEFWAAMCSRPSLLTGMLECLVRDGYDEIAVVGSVALGHEFATMARRIRPVRLIQADTLFTLGRLRRTVRHVQRIVARVAGVADFGMRSASWRNHHARENGPNASETGPGKPRAISRPDLGSADFQRDPHGCFRNWRLDGSVVRLPRGEWLVLGHDVVAEVLKRADLYSSEPFRSFNSTLLGADPPDHTRVRRALNPHFAPAKILARADIVRAHTERFLSGLRERGRFELMSDLATPLPRAILCEWLGIHDASVEAFQTTMNGQPTWEWLRDGLRDEGLLRDLLDEQVLSPQEVTQLTPLLIDAGTLTSCGFIGNAVYLMLHRMDVVREVAQNPSLVSALVDEILRLEPPVFGLARRAREDVILSGQTVREGEMVRVSLAAANRDPARFTDPDIISLDRAETRHISFGAGPHFCLGSFLARLEAETIVTRLLTVLPELYSERPLADALFTGLPGMRHPCALPLAFSQRR